MLRAIWIVIVLLLPTLAQAQTRLGLHVTQEELTIWRARMTDTTNTINGFTFASIYTNRILAEANLFVAQTHPTGDGYWVGYTGAGCVPKDDQSIRPDAGGTPFSRGNGAYLMRSAFTFLLTGDTAYAAPVRTELLNQITVAGTQWANTAKWCPANLGTANALEIVPWLVRVIVAYDYLVAGGYTGLSAGEHTSIRAWFTDAASMWGQAMQLIVNATHYPDILDTPPDYTCQSDCANVGTRQLYYQGPVVKQATFYTFFNQVLNIPLFLMMTGLVTNNTTYQTQAAKYATAYITAGLWDNGAMAGDYYRWQDCTPCPQSMWGHSTGPLNALTAMADMQARAGNTTLYDLEVPTGVLGGAGTLVSLKKGLQLLAQLANKTTLLYGTLNAGEVGPGTLLTWDNPSNGLRGDYQDFGGMVANLYYQDAAIQTAMRRNTISVNNNTGCRDNQLAGCFSGNTAFWADLPYMYGNLEGVVNPFGATTCAVTVPQGSVTIAAFDSQETGGGVGLAINAIDGNLTTMWHTAYAGDPDPPYPHTLTVNLNGVYTVSGFRYAPKVGQINGTIAGYEVHTSLDTINWTLGSSGTFTPEDQTAKDILFAERSAQYVRLNALSEINAGPWAHAAEVMVCGVPVVLEVSPAPPLRLRFTPSP